MFRVTGPRMVRHGCGVFRVIALAGDSPPGVADPCSIINKQSSERDIKCMHSAADAIPARGAARRSNTPVFRAASDSRETNQLMTLSDDCGARNFDQGISRRLLDTAFGRTVASARTANSVWTGFTPHGRTLSDHLRSEEQLRLEDIVRATPELNTGNIGGPTDRIRHDMMELQEPSLRAAARGSNERAASSVALPDLATHRRRDVA
jgi:hypothetical protein